MKAFLLVVIALLSYFLGSLNGAIIISRFVYHKDIRRCGSKNAGLTNMLRTFGIPGAVMVFAVDVVKSLLAIAVGALLGIVDAKETGMLFAGFCLMMGHIYPMYYHFKGGKGALCGFVLFLMVDWRAGLCCLLAFLLIVALTRYVSLGSMASMILSPLFLMAFGHTGLNCVLALLCGLLVVFEHAENILRLIGGTERKLTWNTSRPTKADQEDEDEDFY